MPGYTKVNLNRRKWLLAATGTSGGAVLAAAAIPFVESLAPSEAAKAAGAPVELHINRIAPGALLTAEWRGRPVWVLHRTERMLALLRGNDARLAEPRSEQAQQPPYAANPTRSIRPAFLVATGICTHLGCCSCTAPRWRRRTWAATGPVDFTAPATVPASTWPAASSRTFRHRPIWTFPLTSI